MHSLSVCTKVSDCQTALFTVSVPQRQPLGHFQQKDHFWAFQTKPRVFVFPNFWFFFFSFLETSLLFLHCKCSISSTSAIFISKTRANGLSHHSSCRSILLFLIFFFFVEIWRINVSLPWTRRSQFLKMFLFFHQNDRRLHILFILPLKHSFFQPRLRRATDFLHTKHLLVFLHVFFGRACGGLHILQLYW